MYVLPTQKRFRKRSRIQNLTAQLNALKRVTQILADVVKTYHKGLEDLRESYLEVGEDGLQQEDGSIIKAGEFIWNGEKPAPEAILDIAEAVADQLRNAGFNPDVLFKSTEVAEGNSLLNAKEPTGETTKNDASNAVEQTPAPA